MKTNKIIACDFDGTIVTHEFPKIGKLIPGAKEVIQVLKDNGYKVFLWTMRGYHQSHKRCLEDAVQWCEDNGIVFDGVNQSPSGFQTSSPKQHADLYIDDAALGCPLQEYEGHICADWKNIAILLQMEGYISLEQCFKICSNI